MIDIRERAEFGFPTKILKTERLLASELYILIIKDNFSSTIIPRENSNFHEKHPYGISGFIFLSLEEISNLEKKDVSSEFQFKKLKIISFDEELTAQDKEELKYAGIPFSEILEIHYFPQKTIYPANNENKEIPNLITLELGDELNQIDVYKLKRNTLVGRVNEKNPLSKLETKFIIAYELATNEKSIPFYIPNMLDYNMSEIYEDMELWREYYVILEFYRELSEKDAKDKKGVIETIEIHQLVKILNEYLESHSKTNEYVEIDKLKNAISLVKTFKERVIDYSNPLIVLTENSYIHILMRHFKDFQQNEFKEKSSIPYEISNLEVLIRDVLKTIGHEIELHFKSNPGKPFRRNGKMSIPYNGDYYAVRIDGSGEITTFYINKLK